MLIFLVHELTPLLFKTTMDQMCMMTNARCDILIFTHNVGKMHELFCDHGVWHIEQCPLQFNIQCFALQKNNKHYYMAKIVSTKIIIGIHVP